VIGNVIEVVIKRPFIIIFFGIFTLIYSIFDYYIPVMNIIALLNSFMTGDLFTSLVSLIQWALKLITTIKGMLFVLFAVVFISLLIGIILSGYFSIINNTLNNKSRDKGEFSEGLKKYFIRIWLVSLIGLSIAVVFILILMVAWIPALIVTKAAAAGKSGFFITALLVDFITIGVSFFGLMFLRVYLVFWIPSIFNNDKKAFSKGKYLVDTNFWSLVVRFLLLDILFIVFQSLMINAGTSFIIVIVKWIFNTVYFGFYITYIFSLFKAFTSKMELRTLKQNQQNA
jgi:hypothetical protein